MLVCKVRAPRVGRAAIFAESAILPYSLSFNGLKMSSIDEADSNSEIDKIQAELAAKEKEALEVIKEDICKWLSEIISELEDISASTFMEGLDTGVALCKLITLIQQSTAAAVESGKKLNFTVPMTTLSCSTKAERGSFFARDNTANFISWCRELGVEEAVIFESEGLVLHRDEKRVILCLLDVARYAERVGISPPELVRMEREIEQLEASEGETSPMPWENEVEEKKQKEEECSVTAENQLTPPPMVAIQDKETFSSPTSSKTLELVEPLPDQKKRESVTNVVRSEQKRPQSDAAKHFPSFRKAHYTPSRIPVPIGGSIRTQHHKNLETQNVQLAATLARKLRKRQREEQEPEEGEGIGDTQKVKKLKRSPVSTLATSPRGIDIKSSPQDIDKARAEEVAAVQERHESVDEKVCW